jgi:hypothetical protein
MDARVKLGHDGRECAEALTRRTFGAPTSPAKGEVNHNALLLSFTTAA